MLKLDYFTQAAGPKLAVATGSVVLAELIERFCTRAPLICEVLAMVPDRITWLFGMMVLDMVTGVLAGRADGQRVTSRRLGEGVKRKIAMLAVITASILMEKLLADHGFSLDGMLYRWTAAWFICVEFLSLYENADRMGVKMPTFLKRMVERILQKAETSVADEPQEEQTNAAGQ